MLLIYLELRLFNPIFFEEHLDNFICYEPLFLVTHVRLPHFTPKSTFHIMCIWKINVNVNRGKTYVSISNNYSLYFYIIIHSGEKFLFLYICLLRVSREH